MDDHWRLPCPLSPSQKPLQPSDLTSTQKEWLVDEMRFHGREPKDLGEEWGLKSHTLRQWRRRLEKNGHLQSCIGRPSLLDKDQIDELKESVRSGKLTEAEIGEALDEQLASKNGPTEKPSRPTKLKYERILKNQQRPKRVLSDKPIDPQNIPPRLPCPLSSSDKPLIAAELSAAQKQWLVDEVRYYGRQCKELSEEWGIKPHTLSQWKRRINLNGHLCGTKGRPALLDETQIEALKAKILSESKELSQALERQFEAMSGKRKRDSAPCSKTLRKYEKVLRHGSQKSSS